MKEKITHSFWNFNQEQSYEWAFWKNAFTKDECEKITSIGKSFELYKATVYKDKVKKYGLDGIRDTNVCFIHPNNETKFIFQKITSIVLELNKKYFNFNLLGFQEGLQFTNYKAPSGKYGKHIDKFSPECSSPIRKMSLTVQLSDPKDYKGGNLILHTSEKKTVMDKEQGMLILFPSYTLHEVKKITKGERNSLVGWITGDPFK